MSKAKNSSDAGDSMRASVCVCVCVCVCDATDSWRLGVRVVLFGKVDRFAVSINQLDKPHSVQASLLFTVYITETQPKSSTKHDHHITATVVRGKQLRLVTPPPPPASNSSSSPPMQRRRSGCNLHSRCTADVAGRQGIAPQAMQRVGGLKSAARQFVG